MSITKYYKIVQPQHSSTNILDNQDISGTMGLYGNYTWFHRLVQGSGSRLTRYREYDSMDNDIDVARALDIITEEVMGNTPKAEDPLQIKIVSSHEQIVKSNVVVTLKAALRTWIAIHKWDINLRQTIRNTLKYGDTFYVRPDNRLDRYEYVHAKNVHSAFVAENDVSNVIGWNIKTDFKKFSSTGSSAGSLNISSESGGNTQNIEFFPSEDVVRFSLRNDVSESAPFGESVLRPVYRTFKQKELLEDALIIYRIQRAPERRVFNIDVGNMHPGRVKSYLENVKNEFRQKTIPSAYGGKEHVESIYNPQSMNQDFFLAKRKDGSGTTITTLPSGQNLGSLEDLEYFYKKLWRGLRIPQSYMDTNSDGGTFSDGKVGIAMMQEITFILFIENLQKQIEHTLDHEFKKFLNDQNIKIDTTIFKVTLPEPSNFAKSKQQAMDDMLLQNYNNVISDKSISKRFAQKKYLGLSEEEIIMNARLKLEELGINPDKALKKDLIKIYNDELDEAGGFDGGLSGGGDGGLGPLDEPLFDGDELDPEGMGGDDIDIDDMGEDDAPDDEESEG